MIDTPKLKKKIAYKIARSFVSAHSHMPLPSRHSSHVSALLLDPSLKYLSSRSFSHVPNNLTDSSLNSFDSIIPSTYITSDNKPILIYFSVYEFESSIFSSKVYSFVPKNLVYTVFKG